MHLFFIFKQKQFILLLIFFCYSFLGGYTIFRSNQLPVTVSFYLFKIFSDCFDLPKWWFPVCVTDELMADADTEDIAFLVVGDPLG